MPTIAPTVTIPSPTFMHRGPHDTPEATLRRAASNLRRGYSVGGSNTTQGVADILENLADALAAPPAPPAQTMTLEAHQQALQDERDYHLAMHEAYKPEAVTEIAVHLGSHEDWDHIADWCGGRIENTEDPSGEHTSHIALPDGQVAHEHSWITLDHHGTLRVRTNVDGPETAVTR